MRLPWVSRELYAQVAHERDCAQASIKSLSESRYDVEMARQDCVRLQAQVDKLLDHVTRMDRVSKGIGETPRSAKTPINPMPNELREYIDSFASASVKQVMNTTAYRRHAAGESWKNIQKDVMDGSNDQ